MPSHGWQAVTRKLIANEIPTIQVTGSDTDKESEKLDDFYYSIFDIIFLLLRIGRKNVIIINKTKTIRFTMLNFNLKTK